WSRRSWSTSAPPKVGSPRVARTWKGARPAVARTTLTSTVPPPRSRTAKARPGVGVAPGFAAGPGFAVGIAALGLAGPGFGRPGFAGVPLAAGPAGGEGGRWETGGAAGSPGGKVAAGKTAAATGSGMSTMWLASPLAAWRRTRVRTPPQSAGWV